MPSLGRKEQKGPIREKRQERPNQQFSTFLKQGCSDDAQQQLWNFFLGEEKHPHNIQPSTKHYCFTVKAYQQETPL